MIWIQHLTVINLYGLKAKIVAAKYFFVRRRNVFFWHPKTDLALFLNEFYATIDKISKENKTAW